jgi:hypothetical protein
VADLGGLWVAVSAANNGERIGDATFSADFSNYSGNGDYLVLLNWNQDCWCSAPNYQTCYFNTGPEGASYSGTGGATYSMGILYIALTYKGGWPQTY